MKIAVFGAGAIGTIYGYVLAKAGNQVVHYVRAQRAEQLRNGLRVSILDGRDQKNAKKIDDVYEIRTTTDFAAVRDFDVILVSIKHCSLQGALKVIQENGVTGDVIFFNGLWEEYSSLDRYIPREKYLWGYPVAGGNIDYDHAKLEGALLDHIILNETDGKQTQRLANICAAFQDAGIQVEKPENVLHWIWVHMAINAGVISTCLKVGSARAFMGRAKALREGILTMREALKVVQARGVAMEDYRQETRMYYLPTLFSSHLFKAYFARNELSRSIMEMHNNLDDLYEICNDVYRSAAQLHVDTPLLAQKAKYFLRQA